MSTQTNDNEDPQPVKSLFTFTDSTIPDNVQESTTYSSDDDDHFIFSSQGVGDVENHSF